MTPINKRNLLLAGAAVLGILLLGSVLSVAMLSAPDPVRPSADALEAVNISLAEASQDGERAFVERPLFWASRRPLQADETSEEASESKEAAAKPTKEAGALDKAELVGLYAIGDDGGGAILLRNGAKHRVAMNEEIFGWTLVAVEDDKAVFSGMVRKGEPEVSRELVLEHAMVGAAARADGDKAAGEAEGSAANRKKARRNAARKQSS